MCFLSFLFVRFVVVNVVCLGLDFWFLCLFACLVFLCVFFFFFFLLFSFCFLFSSSSFFLLSLFCLFYYYFIGQTESFNWEIKIDFFGENRRGQIRGTESN